MKKLKFVLFFILAVTAVNVFAATDSKQWIDKTHYFTYDFVKKPKIGPAILKVQIFNSENVQDNKSFEIKGVYFMPTMKSAHYTENYFKISKKGFYLLPVNFVMRGEWEINLTFIDVKTKKDVYSEKFKIEI